MNRILARIGLLLLAFLAIRSTVCAQIEWQRIYGGPFDDACEVRALPDGGFIFISSINSTDTWLVRLDPFGDTTWTRTIRWADFCSVTPTYDGGFFLGGTTRTQIRQEVGYKVDEWGDSLWAQVYADPNDHGMYRVEENDAHGLIITGYVNYTNNTYDMWVRQLDETGATVWANGYGTPGFEFGAMPALCADGGYLFTTTQDTLGTTRYLLVRTNSAGIVRWQRPYSPGRPCGGPVPEALPDGGFLIIGWIELPGNNYNSFLLRTDSLGNPLWTRDYGGLGFEDRTANGVIQDLRGGYTFASMTDLTFGPGFERDIAVYHVDSTGQVMDIRRIGYSADDVPRSMTQSPDSGYAVIGYSQSFTPGFNQVYLAKIAATGCEERFYWPGFPETDTLCTGVTLSLDAGAGFSSYLWSTGDTSRYLQIQGPDTVHVMATNAQGCRHYSNWCRVVAGSPPQFTWAATGLTVQFDGSQAGAWDFGDGSTAPGDDPTHTYTQAGTYIACLTISDALCGSLSICDTVVVIDPLQTLTTLDQPFSIHPNPGVEVVIVNWAGSAGYLVEVYDMLGRRVLEGESDGPDAVLVLTGRPSGAYWIQCVSSEGEVMGRRWLKL